MSGSTTRRGFLGGATVASMIALAGCSTSGGTTEEKDVLAAPASDTYPIDPEEFGSGTPKYTTEDVEDGWTKVTQEGGPTLGYTPNNGLDLIQVDGYAFKDLNRNGKLDLWEDWRQTPEDRAAALSQELPLEFCEGLIIHDTTNSLNEDATDAVVNTDDGDQSELDRIRNCHFRTILDRSIQSGSGTVNAHDHAQWVNIAQAAAEAEDYGVPCTFTTDPSGLMATGWPTNNLAYAATFDPDYVKQVWNLQSKQYRAEGVHMLLGPQFDVATEPRWTRVSGTFGEDPALVRDMGKAVVDGCQSTYDDNGEDQGWGTESILCMAKHWPGDGTGEAGRESHSAAGEYTVYPDGNFNTQLVGFLDGAFKLDGKTEKVAGIMGSYSVAYSDDGEYGDLVGTAYSEWKLKLLRETYGYDGTVCTDWNVAGRSGWGVSDIEENDRYSHILQCGNDTIGGDSPEPSANYKPGCEQLLKDVGDEEGEKILREAARHVLADHFKVGVFENGYVDSSDITELYEGDDATNANLECQLKSIVMLKNKGGVIAENGFGDSPKVYIPMTYTPSSSKFMGGVTTTTPGSWGLPFKVQAVPDYLTVVTDTLADPSAADGGYAYEDRSAPTADQVADCDFAIVFIDNPQYSDNSKTDGDQTTFLPITLQYGDYVADGPNVRTQSVSNVALDGMPANRSYYGQKNTASNARDIDIILETAQLMAGKPVIVAVNTTNPMVFSEFESQVDAILVGFGTRDLSFFDIACGKTEPTGLLPIQMPKDMDTVEAQAEDTPRDMTAYTDSEGNTYDFAFGMNWSGVIDDDRVKTYKVSPILTPENLKQS